MQLKKATGGTGDVPEMLSPIPGMDLGATPPPKSGSALGKVFTALALMCTLATIAMLGLVTWMIWSSLSIIQGA